LRSFFTASLRISPPWVIVTGPEDEIAGPVTITHGGEIRSEAVKKLLAPAEAKA